MLALTFLLTPDKTAVIAVDIGEANPLTSVVLRDGKIKSKANQKQK